MARFQSIISVSVFVPLFVIGNLLVMSRSGRGIEIFVTANPGSECPLPSPCKTLDEYANDTEIFRGNISMIFLTDGIHILTTNLVINQVESLSMEIPPRTESQYLYVDIHLLGGDIILDSIPNGLFAYDLDFNGTKRHGVVVRNTPRATFGSTRFLQATLTYTIGDSISSQAAISIGYTYIEQSVGPGLQVVDERNHGNLSITIDRSNFSNNRQAGIVVVSSSTLQISLLQCSISRNTINSSGTGYAAALSVYSVTQSDATVEINQSNFVHNQDLRGQPIDSIVYVSRASEVSISACQFQDNRGTAIRLANIKNGLHLIGENVLFQNNTAIQGGAIALVSTQVYFMSGAQIRFEDNHAHDIGGAIHVDSITTLYEANDPNTRAECFYYLPEWNDSGFSPTIAFSNNTATNGGYHIYGASLNSYRVVFSNGTTEVRSNDPEVQALFHIEGEDYSPISSTPSRVCVIDTITLGGLLSESCANFSQIFMSLTAYPGEEFSLEVITVGAEFGTVAGNVVAQLLPNNDDEGTFRSQSQCFLGSTPLNVSRSISYSIFSNSSEEVLVLSTTARKIENYGNEDEISDAIQEYRSTGTITPNLLTTPVYITVTLSKCPLGFYFEDKECTCNPKICDDPKQGRVSNGKGIIDLRKGYWVNAYDNGSGTIIMHENCPFDYCKTTNAQGVDLTNPDTQCAMEHSGRLCGKCRSELSLAIGSNKCLDCSDNNKVLLLILFAAAGLILVLFIKILNMTVSQGTINGLIFYANIMWAYQNIFFPERHIMEDRSTSFDIGVLRIFIAWINLDFGIETCFAKGMTAYIKTWLQFAFPLYVWSIAAGVILLARCSARMTKLFGNNSVQVLATLFLLSYAKLQRIVVIAAMPATLHVYTQSGADTDSPVIPVWAFDGNLDYGDIPHIFLLVTALLVLVFVSLPYTFILLFIQPLRSGSNYCCLKWVNRWKPLFDAYTGPLMPHNHFWVGLLLLARLILLLIFSISYANYDPSISLLALVVTVAFLLAFLSYTGQLYGAPTVFDIRFLPQRVSFLSILEASFLLNLIVVGGSMLYISIADSTDSTHAKTAVVFTSVIIAFATFIGIVVYHIFGAAKCFCRKPRLKFNKGYQNLEVSDKAPKDVNIARDENRLSNHSTYKRARVREPLLTESTA